MIFSWEFSKLFQSILFRNIFICFEKLNNIKTYMKPGAKPEDEDDTLPILHWGLAHMKELQKQSSILIVY